jgi:hypothetical protein
LLAGSVFADGPGQSRSTFVPRGDQPKAGLAPPIVPVQAKDPVPEKNDPIVPKKEVTPAVPAIGARSGQDPYEAYIRLEPPGRERLFGTRETERELEERMRQERRDTGTGPGSNDPIVFPENPTLTTEAYQPRKFEPTVCLVEPSYVVYRRLYFEEKNSERYGWDLGPIQPIVSTLVFFKDVVMWPQNIASYPHRRFETNAGQCLPGDPVPYLYYPPEMTGSGLLAEVGVIGLLFYAIP